MTRRSLLWLACLAALLICIHAVLASRLFTEQDDVIINYTWVEVPIYALAVLVTLRDKGGDRAGMRRAAAFILVIAAILRGMVLFIDPVSTDVNRYIWDGRVQDAGINPYLYVPADPALKDLRDDDIYPDINRKEYAPTIYPPLAEIVFYLVTRYDEDITVMKAAMVAFEALAIWAIMRLLKARDIPPTRILLYAWHPLPIWEFAGSGHLDAIAVACVCLAMLAAERRRPILAGIALGGAALTKFFPVVIGPALYRRWDWKLPVAGLATIILLYLPYLGAGKKVFGFLSGYSNEEGYRDGSGLYLWLLLKRLVPNVPQGLVTLYMPLAGLILISLGLAVFFRRTQAGADLGGAFALATTFTFLSSPHYDWYLAWLVPFLCFMPLWSVIWLTGMATAMIRLQWPPNMWGVSVIFLPFLAFLLVEVTFRRLGTKDNHHGNPVPAEPG